MELDLPVFLEIYNNFKMPQNKTQSYTIFKSTKNLSAPTIVSKSKAYCVQTSNKGNVERELLNANREPVKFYSGSAWEKKYACNEN